MSSSLSYLPGLQTITGAMSTLTPPVALEHPENQFRVDYIQDVASQPDFDYPPVSHLHFLQFTTNLNYSTAFYNNIMSEHLKSRFFFFAGVLWAHRNPVEGQRRPILLWKIQWISINRLCKIVSLTLLKVNKLTKPTQLSHKLTIIPYNTTPFTRVAAKKNSAFLASHIICLPSSPSALPQNGLNKQKKRIHAFFSAPE